MFGVFLLAMLVLLLNMMKVDNNNYKNNSQGL